VTRRLALSTVGFALVFACWAPFGSARPLAGATLRVTLSPLVVRGLHFRAGERVRVTVSFGSQSRSRTVTANGQGSFTSGFGEIGFDRCSGALSALAVGRLGDRASYKFPQVLCAP
jgi:hypothetical protein